VDKPGRAGRPAGLSLEPRRAHARGRRGSGAPARCRAGADEFRVEGRVASANPRLGLPSACAAGPGRCALAKAHIATAETLSKASSDGAAVFGLSAAERPSGTSPAMPSVERIIGQTIRPESSKATIWATELGVWSPRSDSNRRPSDYESKSLRPAGAIQARSGCSRQRGRLLSAFLTRCVTAERTTKRMTGLPTAGPPDLGEPSDSKPKVAVGRQPTTKWPASHPPFSC
jgi:hypothetical protein